LGILISGRGSNMESILKAIKKQRIPINPSIVISNKPDAKGLKIAEKLGVKTLVIDSKEYKNKRIQYDKKIIKELEKNGVTPRNGLVCLAGFMRIISPYFIKKYKNRILNIHPALLPAYPGLNAQKQAIQNGAKFSGCTIHFVDEGVDSGPIILQSVVKVRNNDNEKTLSKRILTEEHKIYPEAVKLFAKKKIRLSGKRAIILN
jgi:phosphoribosylglycinamide formyltransferase-1